MQHVLRVAWYRLRVTIRRRWSGYLSLALLIGLVGGLAMGSIAGARQTQSSYPQFLASTNPSELFFSSFGSGGPTGSGNASHAVTASENSALEAREACGDLTEFSRCPPWAQRGTVAFRGQ